MTIRLRHIPALICAFVLSLPIAAQAQSDRVQDAIDARIVVGAFARMCAKPDASITEIEDRAARGTWGVVSPKTITRVMERVPSVPEKAWSANLNGGDILYAPFFGYSSVEEGTDTPGLCGVQYRDLSFAAMAGALEASALFEPERAVDGENEAAIWCVGTYPVAGTGHEVILASEPGNPTTGSLTMHRASGNACPLAGSMRDNPQSRSENSN